MASEETMTTVVVADDHPLILDGIVQLFRIEPGFEVVARCTNGSEALAAVREHEPHLVMLDLRMPEMSGMEVLREIRDAAATHVVLLTAGADDREILEALSLGVRGFILKERAPEQLMECVRRVLRGERWIDPDIAQRALMLADRVETPVRSAAKLTSRELEITRLVANGMRNKEIAERLFISEGTVKTHVRSIFEKLGVEGRVELTLWARDQGLI